MQAEQTAICKSCGATYGPLVERCPVDGAELLSAVSPERRLGQVIGGQFTLRDVIGRGGMGVVYRALQHSMDREVALKLLSPSAATDERSVRRFLREAHAVSRMRHPNVITVFDFGQTGEGELYLVMELLEGRSLGDALLADGPFEPARAVHIVAQACDAVHHAHEQGLVHRDLKPDNVFLAVGTYRQADFVKVLDFGIAKVEVPGDHERITRSGTLFGTPGYVSPEQVLGAPVDARSDVYALGVILFELLAGRLPFQDPAPMRMMLSHLSAEPPPIRQLNPRAMVPEALDAVVRRCLAKRPDERPATALEMADLVVAAVHGGSGAAEVALGVPLDEGDAGVQPVDARAETAEADLAAGAARMTASFLEPVAVRAATFIEGAPAEAAPPADAAPEAVEGPAEAAVGRAATFAEVPGPAAAAADEGTATAPAASLDEEPAEPEAPATGRRGALGRWVLAALAAGAVALAVALLPGDTPPSPGPSAVEPSAQPVVAPAGEPVVTAAGEPAEAVVTPPRRVVATNEVVLPRRAGEEWTAAMALPAPARRPVESVTEAAPAAPPPAAPAAPAAAATPTVRRPTTQRRVGRPAAPAAPTPAPVRGPSRLAGPGIVE